MVDSVIRVQRWDQGALVEDYTIEKPVEQWAVETLTERTMAALANNAEFLALAPPTTAQAVAQVRALTRQMNSLIRLQLRMLDDIEDS